MQSRLKSSEMCLVVENYVVLVCLRARSNCMLQDESHFLKNSKSVRAKKGLSLLKVRFCIFSMSILKVAAWLSGNMLVSISEVTLC